MENVLIVRAIDKKLAGRSLDPGIFWSNAFFDHNIHQVEFYNHDDQVNLNMLYLNKVSYHFTGRKLSDPFKTAEKRFINFLRKKKYDMILFLKGEYVRKTLLDEIRKVQSDAVLANVFPDNPFHYFHAYKAIPCYDAFFVKDTYFLKELGKSGYKNCSYLPMAFSLKQHKKAVPKTISKKDKLRYSSDISFIGSIYPQRQKILENLHGFDLKIWGKSIWDSVDSDSWILKHHQRQIAVLGMKNKIIACSKINLNTHHYQNDIHGCNNRLFEVPAAGGFQLTDYKKDLRDLFRIGKEVAVFSSSDELRELAEYYLDNPEERRRIAEAGHKRAINEHSYTHRLKSILQTVKKS